MVIRTLYRSAASFEPGEIEIELLPGIPTLHVVGLPDANIRESGIRIKSALKSSGFQWPRGHQIVVNLRPAHVRKQSAGVDLAVALGVLAATRQLSDAVSQHLAACVVYGELSLDGRVTAPADVDRALRASRGRRVVTGVVDASVKDGEWLELAELNAKTVVPRRRRFDWREGLRSPSTPELGLSPKAFQALWLAAHLELSVLVAGPQGSGKSTWARLLHALSRPPSRRECAERAELFGDACWNEPWRPLEQPHHTTPAIAMIGGGRPLVPGVVSRAHGGVLILDEFLEFSPRVLEALREPMENGWVEIARAGVRERLPARFQLVATSNLCPCGELDPSARFACRFSLTRCRSTCARLSGPVLDRFDMLVPSHEWLGQKTSRPSSDLAPLLARLARFATRRGTFDLELDRTHDPSALSHRRRRAIEKVARGLADFDESLTVDVMHRQRARALVVGPMEKLRTIFG